MNLSRRTLPMLAVPVAALFLAVGLAFAHHGAAAFDADKTVTVKGTVVELVYMNPHVQVYWETKNEKGVLEKWQGELTAPNKLTRAGWSKRTLNPGDEITVSGNPNKNNPHTIYIRKLIGPDGKSLPLFED
jgi:Family of unknown function (DUF6152)